MKDTILLVGHGSRVPSGNLEIEKFAQRWRARHSDWDIQVCFIELAETLLAEGLERAARDAQRVTVVPLILNAAGHVKMEIPSYIEAARARYPEVQFFYARHLGGCEPILRILKRRLDQAMQEMAMPDPTTTGVILLSRGSSDRIANGDVAKMARWLWEESEHELVDIAFTGVTHPRLERVVQWHVQRGMTQIVVLPYYLFNGRLIERIQQQLARLRTQYPHICFALTDYFGFEDEIYELLDARVVSARGEAADDSPALMECDGCKYRSLAATVVNGHHHPRGHRLHDHGAQP
nr:sirohydrochlorin chelatase [Gammaproteobacteria bacterium]